MAEVPALRDDAGDGVPAGVPAPVCGAPALPVPSPGAQHAAAGRRAPPSILWGMGVRYPLARPEEHGQEVRAHGPGIIL